MSGYYVPLIKIIGFFNADVKKTSAFIAKPKIENMILIHYKVKKQSFEMLITG